MKIQRALFVLLLNFVAHFLCSQPTITIGKGNSKGVNVSTSNAGSGSATLSSIGFLPNPNASSRFLSQATFGSTYPEIQKVASQGIEKWLDDN